MAGRYVILEFDDRDQANAFVMQKGALDHDGATIVAMYLKPKVICECPDKVKHRPNNWRKHRKYGLYICTNCNKPSKFHGQGILKRLQYAFGYSILDEVI